MRREAFYSLFIIIGTGTSIFFDFTELGGAVQLMGIMKLLIDPENMLATALVS